MQQHRFRLIALMMPQRDRVGIGPLRNIGKCPISLPAQGLLDSNSGMMTHGINRDRPDLASDTERARDLDSLPRAR